MMLLLFSCWIQQFELEGEHRTQELTHKCAKLSLIAVQLGVNNDLGMVIVLQYLFSVISVAPKLLLNDRL